MIQYSPIILISAISLGTIICVYLLAKAVKATVVHEIKKFTIDKKSEDDKSKLEELPQITESAEVKSTSESVMEKYAKKEPLPLQEFIDSLANNTGVDTKCNVYKSKFLDCKRVPNRSHVYIDRECATLIKNVLPIIAPDASISGFVSNIVADHLEICTLFVFYHLWVFLFCRKIHGLWDKLHNRARIARVRLWKYRKKRIAEKAKRERRKKIYGKDLPTDNHKPIQAETPQKVEESPPVDDDPNEVMGKSNIIYYEDIKAARTIPTHSLELKQVELPVDKDVNPDDVTRITAFLDDDLDSKFEDAEDAMSYSESNLTEMMDSVDTTLKQFSSIVASIHMNVARATGTH